MSSHLIRQDLIPIVSGYVLFMGALAIGLLMVQRQRRRPTGGGSQEADGGQPAGGTQPAEARQAGDGRPAGDRGLTRDDSGPVALASPDQRRTAARRALLALRRPGWPRLIRYLAATEVGGYLLLMGVVVLYYYGVAKVAGSFLESAVTGCATLIGLSAPVFIAASWLTERVRRRRGDRAQRRDRVERGGRQPAGGA
jgi:Family of unknown function (DUF6256)